MKRLFHQSQLARAGHGLGATRRPQLAKDISDVLLDGVDGDDQLPGDLRVGRSGCDEAQHFQLAQAKRLKGGRLEIRD